MYVVVINAKKLCEDNEDSFDSYVKVSSDRIIFRSCSLMPDGVTCQKDAYHIGCVLGSVYFDKKCEHY